MLVQIVNQDNEVQRQVELTRKEAFDFYQLELIHDIFASNLEDDNWEIIIQYDCDIQYNNSTAKEIFD